MLKKPHIFRRGIHFHDMKYLSCDKPIEVMDEPEIVAICLQQHIGKPAVPVVEKGDSVYQGQLIASADGYVSANIYASVSGEVIGFEKRPNPKGQLNDYILIKNDFKNNTMTLPMLTDLTSESIVERITLAGIVGMGGAGFPTAVKLSPRTPVDTLIINGAECEPYLTCDYRLMLEKTAEVIGGIRYLAKALNVSNIIVGIEKNKPKAIELFSRFEDITVVPLKKAYPMGSEKHLIYCVSGRKVPLGKLPSDAGCVVQNIATSLAVYEAVALGKPLYERVLTVSGKSIPEPKNILVKFGTPFDKILDFCGGVPDNCIALIAGGPMMGVPMVSTNFYTRKTDSGILALGKSEFDYNSPTNCINCGKCARACPMKLLPMSIDFYTQAGEYEKAEKIGGVNNCIECGCCAYVCPAKRSLVQSIALCKSKLRQMKK